MKYIVFAFVYLIIGMIASIILNVIELRMGMTTKLDMEDYTIYLVIVWPVVLLFGLVIGIPYLLTVISNKIALWIVSKLERKKNA